MPVSPNSIITPQTPYINTASLITATAITSRAPITGTTGLTVLFPAGSNTNGLVVNAIRVKIAGSSQGVNTAMSIYVWIYNGTTSYLYDEIILGTATSSTTSPSFVTETQYSNFILPATPYAIYVSESILSNATLTAPTVTILGALL